jgi:hypothetical protein
VKTLVEVTEAIEVLERTPALLDGWLVGLSPEWLVAREGEGTWNALEVVGHLAHNEETDWMTRLEIVLLHGEAQPFEPYEREGFRTRFRTGRSSDCCRDSRRRDARTWTSSAT